MKRTPTQKEQKYLRELVGADGNKAHYFSPASPAAAKRYRERRSAQQVAEMRRAAGNPKSPEK